jgi:uncharacterized protein YeeX (DUF496 family)
MPKDWEKYIKKSQYRLILLEVVKAIFENNFSNYDVKKII